MAEHIKIGRIGENIACGYLEKIGYKLIEKNFREKWGEIDIIMINPKKILTFVEVKTLKLSIFSDVDNSAVLGITPENNMTYRKLEKVKRTSYLYANSHPELVYKDRGWQIDLVAIDLRGDGSYEINSGNCQIRHYENVS